LTLALVAMMAGPVGARTASKTPPEGPGFDGTTIKLGVISPLSGRVSLLGLPMTAGNQMYWDYVNEELGGVGGKYKVELVQEDSQYQPQIAIQNYDKIKDDIVAFQQVLGTQVTKALLPKMQADKLAAVPATLDSAWVRVQNLFPIGGPYQIEAINGLDYYVRNGGKGKTVCALAQDDEYGEAGLEGLAYAKKKLKLKTGPSARFKTGEDLTAQIQQLSDAKCEAVLVVATAADLSAIVTKATALNFQTRMIALAPFWLPVFAESASLQGYLVDNVWIASEAAPSWGDTSVKGMKDLVDRMAQFAPAQKPDTYFLFGYAMSVALHQILEKAVKNGDLSRAGIIKASNQVGTLKFDGLIGNYLYGKKPADRNPPRASTIAGIDPAQPLGWEIVSDKVESKAAKGFPIK
jgi:ABC-type branched-subunit amino acid transport system substrate-binding protein